MAKQHSRDTEITVATVDISQWCNQSQLTRSADSHDTTGYGVDDHETSPGLRKAELTFGGYYDSAAGGPRATLDPLVGTTVAVVRKVEGTGTGKPNQAFSGTLDEYAETAPVADYIAWSAKITVSGAVTSTTQA